MPARRIIVFPQGGPLLPVVNPATMPNAQVGTPYSFQFQANGGFPPYTFILESVVPNTGSWLTLTNAAAGIVSGTPTTAEAETVLVTVQDSVGNMPSAPTQFSFNVTGTMLPAVQNVWPGGADSFRVLFTWWPPASGPTPDYYYIYRNGVLLYPSAPGQVGITATTGWAGNGNGQFIYVDIVGAPSTSNVYQVAPVSGGTIGALSAPLTMTTLAGLGTTLPTPVPDPATWIVAEQLPTNTPVICTTTAQVQSALANSNIGGNNLIVIPKGTVLTAPLGGWTLPAYTGAGGWTYIICDQAIVYNPAGTLIPYGYVPQQMKWTVMAATAAIPAGATGFTLTAPFTGRSAVYPTKFQSSTAGGLNENRACTYTNGSTAVTWNTRVPLAGASTTRVVANFGNFITPGDIGSMATLQQTNPGTSGTIFNIPAGCTNVRFIGLNLPPTGTGVCNSGIAFTPTPVGGPPVAPAQNIYFDRCIVGNDSANLGAGFAYMNHGIANVNCINFLVHQCWGWGFANNGGTGGGSSPDTQFIFLQGSGPFCIQNTFIEAVSEGVLSGGAYVEQTQHPTNLTYRYCHNQKATQWLTSPLGSANAGGPKNHVELKAMIGCVAYGNLHDSCWQTFDSPGQNGCSFTIDVADQGCIVTGQPLTRWTPWLRVTDIDIHDNECADVGQIMKFAEASGNAANVTARIRCVNNIGTGNPVANGFYPASIQVQPWVADVTIDNNTFPLNSSAAGWSPATTPAAFFGITPGPGTLTPNGTPNGLPVTKDRWTITDNITDGAQFFRGDNGHTGLQAINEHLTNYTINKNLFTTDANATYPGTNFPAVPFASIGTQTPITSTYPPAPGSTWNVISGTYATASTTGGPIGAYFGLTIVTNSLPAAQQFASYSFQLQAISGSPVVWAASGLPTGLSISSSGLISGTPTATGTSTVTITATNVGGSATASLSLTVNVQSGAFTPPSLATIAAAGYIIIAPQSRLTAEGITGQNAYNVDPTGGTDSTAGIQAAIDDGCLNFQPVYLPHQTGGAQGIYKITDILRLYCFQNSNITSHNENSGHAFLGATVAPGQPYQQAPYPIIRLAANTTKFNSPIGGLEVPMVFMRQFGYTGATYPGNPSNWTASYWASLNPWVNPADQTSGLVWNTGSADVVDGLIQNIILDCNAQGGGNQWASGIAVNAAQTAHVANVTILATGAYAGVSFAPGNGSVMMNTTVIGGQYGVNLAKGDNGGVPWQMNCPTFAGLTCHGQTVACMAQASPSGGQTIVVGFDFQPASGGVAITAPSSFFSNLSYNISLHNGQVIGSGAIAFPNPGGFNLYMEDVYVSGFTNVTQFTNNTAQSAGSGTWAHVIEYCSTSQKNLLGNNPQINTGSAQAPWPNYNILLANGGTTATVNQIPEPSVSITTSSTAPPSNLVSRHVVTVPTIDNTPLIDIRSAPYNASPLVVTGGSTAANRYGALVQWDSHDNVAPAPCGAAINAAIQAAPAGTGVLIPLGTWEIDQTIALTASTLIVGLGRNRSQIVPHKTWTPSATSNTPAAPFTPMFSTPNNANTTCALVNFRPTKRQIIGTWSSSPGVGFSGDKLIWLLWQSGGQCFTFGVFPSLQFYNGNTNQGNVTPSGMFYNYFLGANAGGRFYGYCQGGSAVGGAAAASARPIFISGTQQPMYFYSLNTENCEDNFQASCAYNIEIANSSNIRIYGVKREGHGNTLLVSGSSNIGFFGSDHLSLQTASVAVTEVGTGCSNIVLQCHHPFSDVSLTNQWIVKDDTSNTLLAMPKILSLLKMGALNDAAMVIGPPGVTPIFSFNNNFTSPPVHFPAGGTGGSSQILSGNLVLGTATGHHTTGGGYYVTGTQNNSTSQTNIQTFTTNFTFQFPAGMSGAIMGLAFIVQNSTLITNPHPVTGGDNNTGFDVVTDANMAGIGAYWQVSNPAGPPENGFQYPIGNSVAVKFDASNANGQSMCCNKNVPGPSSTGLYVGGGPSANLMPEDDLLSSGINFYNANKIACKLVNDGSTLTMVLRDTVTNAQFRKTWPINIAAIVGQNTGWIGFTFGEGPATSGQVTVSQWDYSTGYNQRLATPVISPAAGQYASSQSVSITGPAGASIYYTTNGRQPTSSDTLYAGPFTVLANTLVQAVAIQSGFTDSFVASSNFQIQAAGQPVINFPNGFAGAANLLNLTGVAQFSGANIQVNTTNVIDPAGLTNSSYVGGCWYPAPVNIANFQTVFTLNVPSGNGANGGMTFCIQNPNVSGDFQHYNNFPGTGDGILRWSSGGPLYLGNSGGFGYSGSTNGSNPQTTGPSRSIAIKFDLNPNAGPGPTITGLIVGGAALSSNSVTMTGINLLSATPVQITLSYSSSTKILSLSAHQGATTFNTSWNVDIPTIVGGNTAYVGFTAGAFYGINQVVQNWTM